MAELRAGALVLAFVVLAGCGGPGAGAAPAPPAATTAATAPVAPTASAPVVDPATDWLHGPDSPTYLVAPARLRTSRNLYEVAYRIPVSVGYTSADFAAGGVTDPMLMLSNAGDGRGYPTLPGLTCTGTTRWDHVPYGANWFMWAQEDSNSADMVAVSLVVSGFRPGTAPARFAAGTRGRDGCRWQTRLRRVSTAGMTGDEQWAAVDLTGDSRSGRAAVRVGDVVVAVEVTDPRGVDAAVALAKDLADRAAAHAVASGLVATAAAAR